MPNFGQFATAYQKYRPAYPAEVFAVIAGACRSHEYLVDIGAGTGLSTLPFAKYFRHLTAIDCSGQMLGEIQGRQVRVVQCRAEQMGEFIVNADAITAANSFYWMDGTRVLVAASTILKEGGVFAAFRYGYPRLLGEANNSILQRILKLDLDRFRDPRLRDEQYTERVIRESNLFRDVKRVTIENNLPISVDGIVGFIQATSYGAAFLRTLKEPESYLEQFRVKLTKCDGLGIKTLSLPIELVLAKV